MQPLRDELPLFDPVWAIAYSGRLTHPAAAADKSRTKPYDGGFPILRPTELPIQMVLTAHPLAALAFLLPGSSLALAQFSSSIPLGQMSNPRAVHVADLDGDTDMDVLVGIGNSGPWELLWIPGDAAGGFGAPLLITPVLSGAVGAIRTADLDGDGGLDVLMATSGGVLRLSSQSGGGFAAPELIVAGAFSSLEVVDIEADGDLDVVAGGSSSGVGPSFVLVNDGGAGLSMITLPGEASSGVYPTDADGDGDIDIFAPSLISVTLHLNDGALGFTQVPIAGLVFSLISLGDLDGDGDDDIAAAGFFSNSPLEWRENVGGGAFGPQQFIGTSGGAITPPQVFDVDGDGLNDFVVAQDDSDRLDWYRNLGGGNFGPRIVMDNSVANVRLSVPADVDGDFDDDVLTSSFETVGGSVNLYRNLSELGTTVCTATANSTGAPGALTLTGSRSVGRNRLMASGGALPAGTVGVIIAGQTQGSSMPAGSSGTLCIGGSISRLGGNNSVVAVSPAGTFRSALDLSAVGGAAGGVLAGDLWVFQAWFRDAAPTVTSNFTGAIEVTFEG